MYLVYQSVVIEKEMGHSVKLPSRCVCIAGRILKVYLDILIYIYVYIYLYIYI